MTTATLLGGAGAYGGGKNVDWLRTMRTALISAVWGAALPPDLPAVTANAALSNSAYAVSFPANVSRLDLLAITLPRGGTAVGHVLYPSTAWNGRVLLLNPGHAIGPDDGPGSTNETGVTTKFITNGWIVAQSGGMPTYGLNPDPLVLTRDAGGTISIAGTDAHNFGPIEAAVSIHPLRWFLDPAIQIANHISANIAPTLLVETGISGGGWTTHFHAAVDPRIRRSAVHFGTLPFPLRVLSAAGDWEQVGPTSQYLLTPAPSAARSWWSLLGRDENVAALGCYDPSRRRLQINGTMDPVFTLAGLTGAFADMNALIQGWVPPGQHDVYVDTQVSTHAFGTNSIDTIYNFATAV